MMKTFVKGKGNREKRGGIRVYWVIGKKINGKGVIEKRERVKMGSEDRNGNSKIRNSGKKKWKRMERGVAEGEVGS